MYVRCTGFAGSRTPVSLLEPNHFRIEGSDSSLGLDRRGDVEDSMAFAAS